MALDVGYLNIETFKYLNGLAQDYPRLIQSFAEKVKTNMKSGLQFKSGEKLDPLEEITKENSPELYDRFYKK